MNKGLYKISENTPLCGGTGLGSIWKMVLEGDGSGISAPGQFVNIAVPGKYLRRPISICDWDNGSITIVYRIVGGGTMDMSTLKPGQELELISGLGNGFTTKDCNAPLLVGGGVGLPPMLGLAKTFLKRGIKPIVIAGFSSSKDAILLNEFERLGIKALVATMDGSLGTKGTVMELFAPDSLSTKSGLNFDKIYACGPKLMLKALCALPVDGEFSVEERMGCGFGICMGCSCKTKNGMKRVCKEGPVFKKEDLIW